MVNEFSLFEHEHHVSCRKQQEGHEKHAHIVNEKGVGNDADARAEIPGMTYDSIDSVP
jgi:hypothetical protein